MKKFIFVLFGLLFLGVGSANAYTSYDYQTHPQYPEGGMWVSTIDFSGWGACNASCGVGTRPFIVNFYTWSEWVTFNATNTKPCISTSGCNADYEWSNIGTYTTTIFKINKKEYAPGETITASLMFQTDACANNNYLISEFWGETNGVRKTFFPAGWYPIYNPMVSSVNFSAPLIPGNYPIGYNGGQQLSYKVIGSCACSDPINHCSGVTYNDSCGDPVCIGTKNCTNLTISSSPVSINEGATSTISWNSTNVTSCWASGDWTGSKSVNGSQTVTPTRIGTNSYRLECWDNNGNTTGIKTATVNVACAVNSWSPAPNTVCSGTSFTQTSNCGTTRSNIIGTKICYDYADTSLQGGYYCSGTTLRWFDAWCSASCSAGNCSCSSWTYSANSDSLSCGIATCENSFPSQYCQNGDVYQKTKGYKDTCTPIPTNPCGSVLVDCDSGALFEECETGYTCKATDANNADCVPKSSTWTEV